MLTLPDGTKRSQAEVFAIIDNYCRNFPAVFPLYDLPNEPHDEVFAVDVLAPNALNAWGSGQPMTAMTNAWLARKDITRIVSPISKRPLEQLDPEHAARESEKVAAALEMIDGISGYGWTSSAKFLHRLRPNLTPIWDKWVCQWYGKQDEWTDWVRRVYAHVCEKGTLNCLNAARERIGQPLSILRVWDVILWQIAARESSDPNPPTAPSLAST